MQVNSGTWEDADDAYTARLSSGAAASAVSPTHTHAHAHATMDSTSTRSAGRDLMINTAPSPSLSVLSTALSSANELSVVNWIDSKALFADQETFAEHFEQLRGYVNRYGRGLVIYWHGYNAAIRDSDLFLSTDGMILLADTFPREWLSPLKDTAAPTTPTAASASTELYA